ncbi:60S ribosomal protein L11 [Bonamia ostreae]|uniref:60S ribosomal protein L11 n=1 Tax=Bonamia ostreae TaxID=126728 RepID=A0ABV2AEI0_9EUKA
MAAISKDTKLAKKTNPMRDIRIEKIVINICVGKSTDRVTHAGRVLETLTKQQPVFSKARLTIRTFGIRRNQKIATFVTVRGKNAERLLALALKVKEYSLPKGCFNNTGNFGFGLNEHIDLGLQYDPKVGIFGMDFSVALCRAGKRVSKRKRCRSKVGCSQRIAPEDARAFLSEKYDVDFI